MIMGIPPWGNYYVGGASESDWNSRNAIIASTVAGKVGEGKNVVYVPMQDVYGDGYDPSTDTTYVGDGTHPTVAGYALIASRLSAYVPASFNTNRPMVTARPTVAAR